MSFIHKQAEFEGPLDLLLSLIEQEELDITEISLSKVTDQYLEYVKTLEERRLPEVSEFLVIAARLLVLKSRALLPIEAEEEVEEDDLAQRLRQYKLIKELAGQLGTEWHSQRVSLAKPASTLEFPPELVTEGVSLPALHQTFNQLLERLPEPRPTRTEVLDEQITIEECIDRVRSELAKGPAAFANLFKALKSRLAMIVTFLAILEMIKQRLLAITADLKVSLRSTGVAT